VILLISAPHTAWMDRHKPPHADICWDGVSLTFCVSCHWTTVLPISAYHIAGITSISHQCLGKEALSCPQILIQFGDTVPCFHLHWENKTYWRDTGR
jgi:hypothetical protein